MKKFTLLVAAILVSSISFAQEKGDIRVSGSLAYHQDASEIGINIGAEYLVSDNISIAPSYSSYFVPDPLSLTYLNIDGRYYFGESDTQIYALAGFASASVGVDLGGFGSASASEGGINLGIGAILPFSDSVGANLQAKYTTAASSLVLQAGIAVMF